MTTVGKLLSKVVLDCTGLGYGLKGQCHQMQPKSATRFGQKSQKLTKTLEAFRKEG